MMFAQHNDFGALNNNGNGFHSNTDDSHNFLKRRRTEGIDCECHTKEELPEFKRGRMFIRIPCSDYIFHTEVWKPKQGALYLPLTQDILVNMTNIDQVSFENGSYFIGNCNGEYQKSLTGSATHFWKFDPQLKRLCIVRSILFTNLQIFNAFRECLESM